MHVIMEAVCPKDLNQFKDYIKKLEDIKIQLDLNLDELSTIMECLCDGKENFKHCNSTGNEVQDWLTAHELDTIENIFDKCQKHYNEGVKVIDGNN